MGPAPDSPAPRAALGAAARALARLQTCPALSIAIGERPGPPGSPCPPSHPPSLVRPLRAGPQLATALLLLALAASTGQGESRQAAPQPPAAAVSARPLVPPPGGGRPLLAAGAQIGSPAAPPPAPRRLQDASLSPLELLELGAPAVRYLRAFTTQCWQPVRALALARP